MKRNRRAFHLAVVAALLLLPLACRRPEPEPTGGPRLVLFLVVDQLAYDELERFQPRLTGGLARLLDEGVSFTAAEHRHALTNTAPGHATLATGLDPRHHGIVNNGWFDRRAGQRVYSAADEQGEPSPARLLAPTLGGWLKAVSRRSKVFAASGKDRAALLTAGREADGAFWYERDSGRFVGSAYYPRPSPPWLEELNEQALPESRFGEAWEPLAETLAAGAELGVEPLDLGAFADTFPHPLGGLNATPDDDFFYDFFTSPYGDAYLVDLALALIDGEGLGDDGWVDFLGLSFSSLDAVGHHYGPHSPEVLDTVLRLDRELGRLLDAVDRRIGLDRVVVSLSADHGVVPLPSYRQARGLPGHRLETADVQCYQRAGRELSRRFGLDDWLLASGYLDQDALSAAGVGADELLAALRAELEGCPWIARVWTAPELAGGAAEADPWGRRYAAGFYPERSPDFFVQGEEYFLPMSGIGTTHGSPYRYDRRVPWLLLAPGLASGVVKEPVATVDVAPTVAALAGIEPPAGVDGRDRSPALQRTTPPQLHPDG